MDKDKIDRHEFLKTLGLSGAALLAVYCSGFIESCTSDHVILKPNGTPKDTPTASVPGGNVDPVYDIDFKLDLSTAPYSTLTTVGNFVVVNQIVVAHISKGSYVAVSQLCKHASNFAIVYNKSSNIFSCTVHGAIYDTSGKGLNSLGSTGITSYSVKLDADTNKLRVYGDNV